MQKTTNWTVAFTIDNDDSNLQTVVSASDEYLAIATATHRLTMNREIGIEPIKGIKVQAVSDNEASAGHTIENVDVDGVSVPFHYFQAPMFHEDWHEAEKLGLVYIRYYQHGPDYWDDELLLVPKEHKEAVKSYLERTEW